MNMIIHKEIFICLNIFNVDGRDCTVYIRCTLYNLLHIIQYSQYQFFKTFGAEPLLILIINCFLLCIRNFQFQTQFGIIKSLYPYILFSDSVIQNVYGHTEKWIRILPITYFKNEGRNHLVVVLIYNQYMSKASKCIRELVRYS